VGLLDWATGGPMPDAIATLLTRGTTRGTEQPRNP
jgi:hypothetical protein